jgi:hypothetical protein
MPQWTLGMSEETVEGDPVPSAEWGAVGKIRHPGARRCDKRRDFAGGLTAASALASTVGGYADPMS